MSFTRECLACKSIFQTTPSSKKRYCSPICKPKLGASKLTKLCPICTAEFKTYPSNNKIFCGRVCQGKAKQTREVKKCKCCNINYTIEKSRAHIQYCSLACSLKWRKENNLKCCDTCQKKFKPKSMKKSLYCSKKCYAESLILENKHTKYILQKLSGKTFKIEGTNSVELTNWEIEDIFKLDIINTMDISKDVNVFSLKKH